MGKNVYLILPFVSEKKNKKIIRAGYNNLQKTIHEDIG